MSRREFGRIALAALPAASVVTVARQLGAAEAPTTVRGKPNSKVAGVQLGLKKVSVNEIVIFSKPKLYKLID